MASNTNFAIHRATRNQRLKSKIEEIESRFAVFREALLGLMELSIETDQAQTAADESEAIDSDFEMV